jgi:chromosome segregation ATPase
LEALATIISVAAIVGGATYRLGRKLAELEGAVRRLDARFTSLERDFSTLKSDAALKSDVAALRSDVSHLGARLSAAESALAEVKALLAKVEQELAALKSDVSALKSDLAGVSSRTVTIEGNVSALKAGVDELRLRAASLEKSFYSFGETLIDFLAAKGIAAETEKIALHGLLKAAAPPARTKYYTEEVRRRLLELLDKERLEDWEIDELDRISHLIREEYYATGREDLIDYYAKLRLYIALLRGMRAREKHLSRLEQRSAKGEAR